MYFAFYYKESTSTKNQNELNQYLNNFSEKQKNLMDIFRRQGD